MCIDTHMCRDMCALMRMHMCACTLPCNYPRLRAGRTVAAVCTLCMCMRTSASSRSRAAMVSYHACTSSSVGKVGILGAVGTTDTSAVSGGRVDMPLLYRARVRVGRCRQIHTCACACAPTRARAHARDVGANTHAHVRVHLHVHVGVKSARVHVRVYDSRPRVGNVARVCFSESE